MTPDRSSLLCLKPVVLFGGAWNVYCTLPVGHESVRFEARPCEYRSTFWRGEWVEACQRCGGPLEVHITTEDDQHRLICGACCSDDSNARVDALFAEIRAESEGRRRAELRKASRSRSPEQRRE